MDFRNIKEMNLKAGDKVGQRWITKGTIKSVHLEPDSAQDAEAWEIITSHGCRCFFTIWEEKA